MVVWKIPTGPKTALYRPFRIFNRASPEKYGGSYIKNCLAEAPELFISIVGMVIGTLGAAYLIKKDMDTGYLHNKPFRPYYIVIRPDDPLIEEVKQRPAYYKDPYKVPDHPIYERYKDM